MKISSLENWEHRKFHQLELGIYTKKNQTNTRQMISDRKSKIFHFSPSRINQQKIESQELARDFFVEYIFLASSTRLRKSTQNHQVLPMPPHSAPHFNFWNVPTNISQLNEIGGFIHVWKCASGVLSNTLWLNVDGGDECARCWYFIYFEAKKKREKRAQLQAGVIIKITSLKHEIRTENTSSLKSMFYGPKQT